MCRAVWVMIVGPTTEANKTLRRAAGPDAQVVAMATSAEEALSLLTSPSDVIVIDGNLDGARELISSLQDKVPAAAIVWVGDDPPERAHASVPEPSDALEGAITRGLLAARAAK
jgi:DNA-binding NarL/FixJ family response regulator